MFNPINEGTIIKSIHTDDLLYVIFADYSDNIPVWKAKWINEDGSLSKGYQLIVGSQMYSYIVVEQTAETIADDFNNMDLAIAGFFSQIYK